MKTLIEKIDEQIKILNNVPPEDWDETEAFNYGLNTAAEIVENHTCCWHRDIPDRDHVGCGAKIGDNFTYCPHCGGRIILK